MGAVLYMYVYPFLFKELKREQGQKTNLTQNLAKVKEDYRKSMMFMDVGPDWEEKMKEDKTKETRLAEV